MGFQVFVVRLQVRNRIFIPLQGLFGILFACMLQRLFYRKPLSQALYHFVVILDLTRGSLFEEWDLYKMYKLCGDWKTILIDFSPELIPACLGQNQCPQTQHNAGALLFPSHS